MSTMIDFELLDAIDARTYRAQKPFPFVNPENLVRREAWEELEATLPTLEDMDESFGKQRVAGQEPHDRYSLEYTDEVRVSPAWKKFIDELRGDRYRKNVCRLYGVRNVEFRFHWHYAPPGRSVSPHVDQSREYGSHIFYFNAPEWQDEWGGHTLVMDDHGRLNQKSAPALEDFDDVTQTECVGSRSLLFLGRGHGWHAVKPIRCPEGYLRRVFIIVIGTTNPYWRIRDWVIGKKPQRY